MFCSVSEFSGLWKATKNSFRRCSRQSKSKIRPWAEAKPYRQSKKNETRGYEEVRPGNKLRDIVLPLPCKDYHCNHRDAPKDAGVLERVGTVERDQLCTIWQAFQLSMGPESFRFLSTVNLLAQLRLTWPEQQNKVIFLVMLNPEPSVYHGAQNLPYGIFYLPDSNKMKPVTDDVAALPTTTMVGFYSYRYSIDLLIDCMVSRVKWWVIGAIGSEGSIIS